MKAFRWCASLAAVAGLTSSLLLGSAVSSTASAAVGGEAAVTVSAWSGIPATARTGVERAKPQAGQQDRPGPWPVCLGLLPPPYAYADSSRFFCDDWRLGPTKLPTRGVLGAILNGYHRFGGLTPMEFLNKWWDPAAASGRGNWRYPDFDGYELDTTGNPIARHLTLHQGQLVDRFGNEFGRFLSPAGARYGERGLPPSNLDTVDPSYPYDYHLYRVTRDVVVCAGPIAPTFEQPGNGVQYVTSSQACDDPTPRPNVATLVANRTLVRLN